MSKIKEKIDAIRGRLGYLYYTRIFTPVKVWQVRHKKIINVIFVITELGPWKTESLYLAMLEHPRFKPVLRVIDSAEYDDAKYKVFDYLKARGYEYEYIKRDEPLQKGFRADIIFYQKPYLSAYYEKHRFLKNRNALFCYATYAVHTLRFSQFCNNTAFANFVWQYYFENSSVAEEISQEMDNNGRNIVITGVPMMDGYLLPTSSYNYHWKCEDHKKKRIIWAPHFSFETDSILHYSTFMSYCDVMLELAKKYGDYVEFVLKPHPLLIPHLCDYWGKERTEEYFKKWIDGENTQLELGAYANLFMTSDAMIHDCSSFTSEYCYTRKPVLYLLHDIDDKHRDSLTTFTRMAFDLHYKGFSTDDIENFIKSVINGIDKKSQERELFFLEYLQPPFNHTASENIISAILGLSMGGR